MGMFDTFLGTTQCPNCGSEVKLYEQTKNYECLMQDFKVGDYIDKGNLNYFYEFEQVCPECEETFTVYAAIRRGQLIGYYTNISGINILDFENIEDGYQRRIEYEEMCKNAIGVEAKRTYTKEPIPAGEVVNVLNDDWIIDEVYQEVLKEQENERLKSFLKWLYKNNYIYVCHNREGLKRIIVSRDEPYTSLKEYGFEAIESNIKKEEDFLKKYTIQSGCKLNRLFSNGMSFFIQNNMQEKLEQENIIVNDPKNELL